MDTMSSAPERKRVSPALVGAWLVLTLDAALFRLWQQNAIEQGIEAEDIEAFYESLMLVSTVHWVVILATWAVLIAGLWATASSRDAKHLRQAAGLLGAQLAIDALSLAMNFVAPDVAGQQGWALMSLVSLGLTIAGGASIVAHAKHNGVDSSRVALPIAGLVGMGLLALSGLLIQLEIEVRLFPLESYRYIVVGLSLLFWLSWLAIPREVLSLDASAPDGGSASEGRSTPSGGSRSQDILVGLAWAGGGILVTLVTMTGGGIDGRAVLAWGPIVYGLFRILRGFARDD